MKILMIWQSSFPWEVRVEKFADCLLEQGNDVAVLCRHKDEALSDERISNGTRVLRVGAGLSRMFSVPLPVNQVWRHAIDRAIDRDRPDLVIVRDLPLAELAARAARARRIPVVMDMAEHYPAAMRSWKKYHQNPIARLFVHRFKTPDWLEKRAVRLMDGIITVCDEQTERLNRSYGYPKSKMRVVNNSPKLNWFAGARKGVSAKPRIFGHHGHMTPERGLNVLLEAFADVQREFPDIELRLAGSGESADDVNETVARLGIQDNVKLLGRYSHSDLDRLYGAIDIAVLPYPPNELINHTLSNKIFDYMACGKPLITSAATPMKRLMAETKAGLSFEPWTAAALAETMKSALTRDLTSYSERGMSAFRERFHWEADVMNLLNFVHLIRG
jgi:glycosyltransferase involved in cell wall biosynthesis